MSEKRYKADEDGFIVDKTMIKELDIYEVTSRLNDLEAERDRLKETAHGYAKSALTLKAERDQLREALRTTAHNVGAAATPEASTEFLLLVPDEVKLVVLRLRSTINIAAHLIEGGHADKARRLLYDALAVGQGKTPVTVGKGDPTDQPPKDGPND